jgi:hypothetical protein
MATDLSLGSHWRSCKVVLLGLDQPPKEPSGAMAQQPPLNVEELALAAPVSFISRNLPTETATSD